MLEMTEAKRLFFKTQGQLHATNAAVHALIQILSPEQRQAFLTVYALEIEAMQTSCLPQPLPEEYFQGFEEESQQLQDAAS